jgi:hypothetical protein
MLLHGSQHLRIVREIGRETINSDNQQADGTGGWRIASSSRAEPIGRLVRGKLLE